MLGGHGADEGVGQVVSAADGDGEQAALEQRRGGFGHSLMGFFK